MFNTTFLMFLSLVVTYSVKSATAPSSTPSMRTTKSTQSSTSSVSSSTATTATTTRTTAATTTTTDMPTTLTTEQHTTTTELTTTESSPETTTLLSAATTNTSSPTSPPQKTPSPQKTPPPQKTPSSSTKTIPITSTSKLITGSVSTTSEMSVTDNTTVGYIGNSASVTKSSKSNSTNSYATDLVTSTSSGETYMAVNGSCLLGFVLQKDKCVYLCKDRICENGGVCTVETDADGKRLVAMCRCKQDDDVEYSGDNCEVSKPSRLKERKITLGVLIPVVCILLLILTCACVKLRRRGKTARDLKNNYDLNSGAL